jgi:TIR domain/Pentapeptide repeats (8 copies)
MANPEHVEILKQGVQVWNQWRQEFPKIVPDLSGADLSHINLSYSSLFDTTFSVATPNDTSFIDASLKRVDLSEAYLHVRINLSDVNLNHASLSGAILNNANLSGADLSAADLSGANLNHAGLIDTNFIDVSLRRADLSDTFLMRADLSRASLLFANLSRAIVKDADFTSSRMCNTTLAGVDLGEAKGLETVWHHCPSTIGIDTLYQSAGMIPEAFLRGCGVSDEFIAYARSLVEAGKAIQFYTCFISYSSKNQDFAVRLYSDLQNKGVRCWYAPEDLKIGDKIRDCIDESIKLRDKLLLILSEHSITSDWVEQEVESALEEERQRGRTILFPIRLDDAVMESNKAWAALIRRTRHIGDFTRWKDHDSYQKAFDRLLRDLKAEEKKT